jgi:hypothetical protein
MTSGPRRGVLRATGKRLRSKAKLDDGLRERAAPVALVPERTLPLELVDEAGVLQDLLKFKATCHDSPRAPASSTWPCTQQTDDPAPGCVGFSPRDLSTPARGTRLESQTLATPTSAAGSSSMRGGPILVTLGMITVVAGALRLSASMLAADTKGRRNALYWVITGAVTAIAQL